MLEIIGMLSVVIVCTLIVCYLIIVAIAATGEIEFVGCGLFLLAIVLAVGFSVVGIYIGTLL